MSPGILKYLSLCIFYFKEIVYMILSPHPFLLTPHFEYKNVVFYIGIFCFETTFEKIIIIVSGEVPYPSNDSFILEIQKKLHIFGWNLLQSKAWYHFSFSYGNNFRTYVIHPCILELPDTKELFEKC